MTTPRHTVLAIATAAASFGAFSQSNAEHTQHHAPEPAKNALTAPAVKSAAMPQETMGAMDEKIKAMREMHEKMMNATTPEERKALMADHMKTMQDGMSMMEKMGTTAGMPEMGDMKSPGKKPDAMKGGRPVDMMGSHDAMQKRMEMMTTMMQMMMDRLPPPPAQ